MSVKQFGSRSGPTFCYQQTTLEGKGQNCYFSVMGIKYITKRILLYFSHVFSVKFVRHQ